MQAGRWSKPIAMAVLLGTLALVSAAAPTLAQDMLRYLDLKSEEFTKADVTRAEIEAALAAAGPSGRVDLSGKRLNGLDLSALDLRRTKLQATRLNHAK